MNIDKLTKDELRQLVHAAIKEEQCEHFLKWLKDDEYFLKDLLNGTTEEEQDRYFEEFPEFEKYRNIIRKK